MKFQVLLTCCAWDMIKFFNATTYFCFIIVVIIVIITFYLYVKFIYFFTEFLVHRKLVLFLSANYIFARLARLFFCCCFFFFHWVDESGNDRNSLFLMDEATCWSLRWNWNRYLIDFFNDSVQPYKPDEENLKSLPLNPCISHFSVK